MRKVKFHPHALQRMRERGAAEEEVISTINNGEQFSAKFGRIGFRKNFRFENKWQGKYYNLKQIEAFAVNEKNEWVIITVITRYF